MWNLQTDLNKLENKLADTKSRISANIESAKERNTSFDFDKTYLSGELSIQDIYNLTSYWISVYRNGLSNASFGSETFNNVRGNKNPFSRNKLTYEQGFDIVEASCPTERFEYSKTAFFIMDVHPLKALKRLLKFLVENKSGLLRDIWLDFVTNTRGATVSIETFVMHLLDNFVDKHNNNADGSLRISSKITSLLSRHNMYYREMELTDINHGTELTIYGFEAQYTASGGHSYESLPTEIKD